MALNAIEFHRGLSKNILSRHIFLSIVLFPQVPPNRFTVGLIYFRYTATNLFYVFFMALSTVFKSTVCLVNYRSNTSLACMDLSAASVKAGLETGHLLDESGHVWKKGENRT